MKCQNCKADLDPSMSVTCVECGHDNTEFLSVGTDKVDDDMIARASIPNLASLYKAGKAQGNIKPQQDYQASAS
jgi:hypothetical protein